jgi:hypothetical protein
MNRLQSELHRLYLVPAAPAEAPRLTHEAGEVRALVMELARPADWTLLGEVWRGVQAELGLPAPGIAVSGRDGLQLWFSLQEPVHAAYGARFLALLRQRYLAGVPQSRLRLLPSTGDPLQHADLVPAQQAGSDNWSAFVAPDLAPVFADTPWLDVEPSADGQAELLARLVSIKPAAFDAAVARLQTPSSTPLAATESPAEPATRAEPTQGLTDLDPRRFLQDVLNDASLPLVLRIDAAKALLHARTTPGA